MNRGVAEGGRGRAWDVGVVEDRERGLEKEDS